MARDHLIATLTLPDTKAPVLCLIGGKWTTFRGFSEQATDQILRHQGLACKACTAGMAIGGGKGMPRTAEGVETLVAEWSMDCALAPSCIALLLSRYGTRARLSGRSEGR